MTDKAQMLDAALTIIAKEGYANFSLSKLAMRTGTPLADLYQMFTGRSGLLTALSERLDEELKAAVEPSDEGTARDRIFDVVMTRLELLAPYKAMFVVMAHELPQVPQDAVIVLRSMIEVCGTMLELAGVDISGLKGRMRVQSLIAIYARVLKAWVRDDDPGLAPTMALLDRWLRRTEQVTPNFWS